MWRLAVAGLQGAVLMARGRPDGIRLFSGDRDNVRRSFWAMAWCIPLVLGLRFYAWIGVMHVPPQAPRMLMRDGLVFAASWLAFAVLTYHLAPAMEREQRWPRFIVAWNWCNVVENLLILLGGIPGLLGAPALVDQVSQVFTLGWAFWLEWSVTRLVFGVSPLLAAFLVILDQCIGFVLTALGIALGGG